jgi:hypothetical protein
MRNSKLTTITDALLLTIAFILFINSVLEMKDTVLLKKKLLERIFQNEDLTPIKSISVTRNFCDKDNNFTSFFNYTFQGVEGGSYNTKTKVHSDSKCSREMGDDYFNCVNIPKIKQQFMSVWEDKVLCLQRYSPGELDYKIVPSNEICDQSYVSCGYYNQYYDKLCVKDKTDCPINYIEIKNLSDIDFSNPKFEYNKLENNHYLVTSKNFPDNILPIDFYVAEYYPCLEVERISFNYKYPVYPYINNKDFFGCERNKTEEINKFENSKKIQNSTPSLFQDFDEIYDRRYQRLFSLLKKNFFFDNDLLEKYKTLPSIKGWKNDIDVANYTLSMRNYISVNLTCSNSINFDFKDLKSKLHYMKQMKFKQMVFALLNIFALCFFISLLSLVKIIKRWLHTILTLIKIIFSALYLTYVIILSYENFDLTNLLKDYLEVKLVNCVDKYVNSGIQIYGVTSHLEDVNFINRLIFYFSIFYGCILGMQFLRVLYKIYVRIKNTKRRKEARNELGKDLFKNILQTKNTLYSEYKEIED